MPIPKSLAWSKLRLTFFFHLTHYMIVCKDISCPVCPHSLYRYNIRSEDEPILRYVPYFGDDDTTGIDVSAYDKLPGDIEPEIRYDIYSLYNFYHHILYTMY